jgi:hypothetical protein
MAFSRDCETYVMNLMTLCASRIGCPSKSAEEFSNWMSDAHSPAIAACTETSDKLQKSGEANMRDLYLTSPLDRSGMC